MLIVNAGTGPVSNATVENADVVVWRAADVFDFGFDVERDVAGDHEGYFRYVLKCEGREVTVDVPSDDPDVTCESDPMSSKRLYVDGSSWFFGFALPVIEERLADV